MGQPVVHFEIIGQDAENLQAYYSELFGWEIDADNPMKYPTVQRDGNVNADGAGIGGGVGTGSEGYAGHVGPDEVMEGLVIGLFADPEGHTVGVVKTGS